MPYNYTPYKKKEYQPGQDVIDAQNALQQHQQNKPGEYQSKWKQQMEDLMSQYQNRDPFQYDINADAMYKQMVDRYVQQGKQAMIDTVGQSAALTGGYGNSYAQTAGQQTYQGYLQGANDMMPQFYQMALDRYQDEGNQMLNKYNLLANQEDMEYSRYNDTLNRYLAELDRLQGVYESERDYDYSRFKNEQAFDYGVYSDEQNRKYQIGRDEQNFAKKQVDYLLSLGIMPKASLLKQAGYSKQYVKAKVKQNKPVDQLGNIMATFGSGGGGNYYGGSGGSSGSGGSGGNKNPISDDDKKAMDFVENMLNNASGSAFDPNRVISGTNYLNDAQKKTAREYLDKIIGSGAMKIR